MITPILFRRLPIRWLTCLAVSGLWVAYAAQGAEVDTGPVKFVVPRSVFVDDPKTGKDPFPPRRGVWKVLAPSV
jgi:hypothetical protein